MSTASRRLDVLRAIVIEYVNTKEPVASKAVSASHVTGVSSATIRNDMGALEDQGLIHQPHTSAGRIPTEAGYRLFVECLDPSLTLHARERNLIEHGLAASESLEDAVARTVRVLAGITGQAALAEYPDLVPDKIRRIEIIDLEGRDVLVLVVTSVGRVFERRLTIPTQLNELVGAGWDLIRDALNQTVEGKRIDAIDEESGAEKVPPTLRPAYRLAADAVKDALRPLEPSRVITAGAANLARAGIDFHDVAQVLDVLEDQSVLLRLLRTDHEGPLHVAIGAGELHEGLTGASLISANYGGASPNPNHVGVIGPTRMDYARSLAAVEAVSQYLSRLLLRQSGREDESPLSTVEPGEETT